LPSALTLFVCAPVACSRGRNDPPCIHRTRQRSRVHRIPHPTSVTTMIRPLWARGGNEYASDLGRMKTKIFLQMGLDSFLLICTSGTINPKKAHKCNVMGPVTDAHRAIKVRRHRRTTCAPKARCASCLRLLTRIRMSSSGRAYGRLNLVEPLPLQHRHIQCWGIALPSFTERHQALLGLGGVLRFICKRSGPRARATGAVLKAPDQGWGWGDRAPP
jgi:hypothetical protein